MSLKINVFAVLFVSALKEQFNPKQILCDNLLIFMPLLWLSFCLVYFNILFKLSLSFNSDNTGQIIWLNWLESLSVSIPFYWRRFWLLETAVNIYGIIDSLCDNEVALKRAFLWRARPSQTWLYSQGTSPHRELKYSLYISFIAKTSRDAMLLHICPAAFSAAPGSAHPVLEEEFWWPHLMKLWRMVVACTIFSALHGLNSITLW